MLVLSCKINGALVVYHVLDVEQDGLGQTVIPAPPVVDAVSTAISFDTIIIILYYRKISEGSVLLLHHEQ